MNADDSPRTRQVADLVRRLPVPAERDLPAGRRNAIKEHLMTELRTREPAVKRGARARRTRRTAWTAAGISLLAAAAAAVSVIVLAGHTGSTPGHGGAKNGQIPAVELLSKIAHKASQARAQEVTDNQFEYIETEVANGHLYGDPAPSKPHLRQVWIPVSDLCGSGLAIENGKRYIISDKAAAAGGAITCPYQGSLNEPSYRFLQSLPTDPHALLNLIYKQTAGHGESPDQEAFTTIGDLLRGSIAPPAVSAALYKAAALIPGVTVVPDAVDAVGRSGVAVSFTSNGEQSEWIFDKQSLQMLGELDFVNGTLTVKSAIMTRAFVDHAGEVPPAS